MQLWYKPGRGDQQRNIERFRREIVMANPDIDFFQPNYSAAPWHVQAMVGGIVMNFWPHNAKACNEREKSVEGFDAIKDLIEKNRQSAQDDFDLLDEDDLF